MLTAPLAFSRIEESRIRAILSMEDREDHDLSPYELEQRYTYEGVGEHPQYTKAGWAASHAGFSDTKKAVKYWVWVRQELAKAKKK